MPRIHYVYPNITELAQRGGLAGRWRLAAPLGGTHVEVPADFIKNRTEVERTGQDIGAFLSWSSIELLYERGGCAHDLLIRPGVNQQRRVGDAIAFCERMLTTRV